MKYANMTVCASYKVGEIDNRIYGSFIEHLGRAVYGGIYEPGHPAADQNGFRTDVAALIRELDVPVVRYPGGNFVSGYNWEDGVGPVEQRPRRLELAWGTTEPNTFGTDEFMRWCNLTGIEPMMAVNLGTRGPDAARNLVEYCNHPGGTYWSDLRKKNGAADPYKIKLWCLGNEMDGHWQMGHKNAEAYGRVANEAAKLMKWTDPSVQTILCGSSSYGMKSFGDWETQALSIAYDNVDYISMHQYHGNSDDYLENFLAKGVETEAFLKSVIAALDFVQGKRHSKKRIDISFDEWNVWYHSHGAEFEKWSEAPHILEDVYNFADALVVGTMMNAILRHADRVKIACLAQLVNVIAPIMTENGGKAWKQTIFYPFLFASKYGRGTSLQTITESSRYDTKWYTDVPHVDTAAVCADAGDRLVIFAVNRDTQDAIDLNVKLLEFEGFAPTRWTALENGDPYAVNTAEHEAVAPIEKPAPQQEDGRFCARLQPMSWNMFVFEKTNG